MKRLKENIENKQAWLKSVAPDAATMELVDALTENECVRTSVDIHDHPMEERESSEDMLVSEKTDAEDWEYPSVHRDD